MAAWWWILAGAFGWFPLALLTVMLWQAGRPPFLGVWPRSKEELQITTRGVPRALLVINALTIEIPSLALGAGMGGIFLVRGEPWGLTVLEAFGIPPLLHVLATCRVLLLRVPGTP
jgi:hypothetical protein